jgi:DDE_Tnp_1-associated
MDIALEEFSSKPRLKSLLDQLSQIADPRDVRRVAFQLREVLVLVVYATICDCDDYDHIAGICEPRRYLPYENGVPGGRWFTRLMNRIGPGQFEAAFSAFVRVTADKRTIKLRRKYAGWNTHDFASILGELGN